MSDTPVAPLSLSDLKQLLGEALPLKAAASCRTRSLLTPYGHKLSTSENFHCTVGNIFVNTTASHHTCITSDSYVMSPLVHWMEQSGSSTQIIQIKLRRYLFLLGDVD